MDVNTAIRTIESKYSFNFKEKQIDAIKSILEDRDTFVVLPTGYGKSKIFTHLPEFYEMVRGSTGNVLVISPLQSLMIDQVMKLTALNISATFVGERQKDTSTAPRIQGGNFSIVFSSPEAALQPGLWRKCLTTGAFCDNLRAVIIDESHCITEWGGEFRQEYGKLSELRSVFTDVTFVAMTATATTAMKSDIMKKLDMVDDQTTIVYKLPNRDNITYIVRKSNRDMAELNWLLDDVLANKENAKKTIVYCRNISMCADLYEHFSNHLTQSDRKEERLVAMFHRSTASANKEYVLEEFVKPISKLRIVFATVAFGMGIDIPDVNCVIHWGAPRGLEQFAQESGRACRDGRPSYSVVYFTGRDIGKDRSTVSMKAFCTSDDCLRSVLNDHFKLDNCRFTRALQTKCSCCIKCFDSCDCQGCVPFECLADFTSDLNFCDGDRQLSAQQVKLLKDNLIDFQDCLLEENSIMVDSFDESVIESIVNNCHFLLCEDDVIDLGLQNHALAKDIIELIEEVC